MASVRLRPLYTGCVFRALIDNKNVAPRSDRYAEGALYISPDHVFYIVNRKAGDCMYTLDRIMPDTLELGAGFVSDAGRELFEGDIIELRRYRITPPQSFSSPEEEAEFYGSINLSECEECFYLLGAVVYVNGVFCVCSYNNEDNMQTCIPLYIFFGYDMSTLPDVSCAVIGNASDDGELYAGIMGIPSNNAENDGVC